MESLEVSPAKSELRAKAELRAKRTASLFEYSVYSIFFWECLGTRRSHRSRRVYLNIAFLESLEVSRTTFLESLEVSRAKAELQAKPAANLFK